MGGKQSAPPTPEPQPVVRMPDKESMAANQAKMEKQRKVISQSGRESTLLSDDSMNTTLGG
jgi:hypothetical protein